MPRISDQELTRLKQNTPLEQLVRAKGIDLKSHGKDLIGLCPFHDDHDPSLVISPDKNLWHCLGACQTGGSVIDWVMKCEGVSFRYAVELLRKSPSSLAASSAKGEVKNKTARVLPPVLERAADDATVLRQVVDFYHAALKQSPEAQTYLTKRGLNDPKLIEHFKLGYANRTLAYRLPRANRKEGAQMRGLLQRLGILRSTGHEHLNGSVVVPILDGAGAVQQLYGRKITPHLRKGTPLHLYLPGPHRCAFNVAGLLGHEEAILCKSLLDALTVWLAGYRNVTTSYGIEGFGAAHLEAFRRCGTKRVLIAYDRDDAGDKAAAKLSEQLQREGLDCYRILFPKGMDANDFALQVKPASKSVGVAIRSAVWLGKGVAPKRESEPKSESAAESAPISAPARVAGSAPVVAPAPATEPVPVAAPEPPLMVPAEPPTPPVEPIEPPPAALPMVEPVEPPPAPLLAARVPHVPESAKLETETSEDEIILRSAKRRWRVRGLERNKSFGQLRINLLCSQGSRFHVDNLDLYAARQRYFFVKQASMELQVDESVVKEELSKVLLELEAIHESRLRERLGEKETAPPMTPEQTEEALALLRDPNLLERIVADFDRCGVVGERTNKLVGYLAACSRKLDKPLAVILQSSSAAGKSSLMDAVLSLMPEEERAQYSAMTGQSLFYMGETDLKHKILAIVEEEGATKAAYALKILQSEGLLVIASTGKDPTTGRLVTQEYRVEGPVMIFLTTTAIDIQDDLLNRCIVLTVDEARSQTEAIHRQQRLEENIEGFIAQRERAKVLELHQNAQRLLRPIYVSNPFADQLTFVSERTRTRRDHQKYLTLIRTIALLHQYQRPYLTRQHGGEVVTYIEVTVDDVAMANRLAHEVLGRSLDELPPQTRRLLLLIDEMVVAGCKREGVARSDYRFTRRDVRAFSGFGNTQLKVHMQRLEELEYLLVYRGGRGKQLVYELLFDRERDDGTPFLRGLVDIEELKTQTHDGKWSGSGAGWSALEGNQSGSSRPQVGVVSGPSRGGRNGGNPNGDDDLITETVGEA